MVLGNPKSTIFVESSYPKGTSLGQDASFEPSAINISPGVRPVDVRKKKREGWIQQRDITRMC